MAKKKTLRRIELVFTSGAMNPDIHVEYDVQILLADGVTPDPEEAPRIRRETITVADVNADVDIPGLGKKKLSKLIEAHHAESTALRTQLEATITARTTERDQAVASLEAKVQDLARVTAERDAAVADKAKP